MTIQNRIKTRWILAALAMAIFAGPAQAGPPGGQLGILTPEILEGNNPTTGAPWAVGDTYRFAFFTSETTTAESPDISTYNAFVQNLANATTIYEIGSDDGVTWKVIGSTSEVDAIDNTSTNWTDESPGSPIYLLDGSTLVAKDYRDLWDGDIQHIINITEQGVEYTWWPWTGTYWDGTASEDHGGGSGSALGSGGQVGQGNSSSTTDWIWRIWTMDPSDLQHNLYALSDPLEIIDLDPRCPSKLTASGGPGGVTLGWQNGNEMPTSVRILWETLEIENAAPVDPPTYTDAGAQPGLIEYELIFTMPGDACESLTTTYNACITDLAATRSMDTLELTWTNNLAYDGIEVRRDGEVLEASLAGTADTYTDVDPPREGFATYAVVPTDGMCDPATVEVDMNIVLNAGFEEPVLADGEYTETDGPYWKLGYYDIFVDPLVWIPGGDDGGIWNPDAVDGFSGGAAFAGQNTGWATSGAGFDAGLSQVLTATLEVDTVYTLSVQVGNAFYNGSDLTAPFRLELLAGGVLLAAEGGDSPVADTWELHTLVYNSDNHPDQIGEQLEIRLIAELYVDGGGQDGYQVDFDEVLLTISPDAVQDPEPPENVVATADGTTITINWDPPSGGPEPTNYVVLRGNAGDVPPGVTYAEIHEGPANEFTLTDSGLDPRTAYCYVVRSRDSTTGATSADSNEACATTGTGEAVFKRGDADGNGAVELTDVIRALTWQFVGDVEIPCQDAADIDDDGEITLTDAIRSLNYQFAGIAGTIPEPPGPLDCGPDAGPDTLPECVYQQESCQ